MSRGHQRRRVGTVTPRLRRHRGDRRHDPPSRRGGRGRLGERGPRRVHVVLEPPRARPLARPHLAEDAARVGDRRSDDALLPPHRARARPRAARRRAGRSPHGPAAGGGRTRWDGRRGGLLPPGGPRPLDGARLRDPDGDRRRIRARRAALLGRRVPRALVVFVLALAVADDIGSVVVLALGYSEHVDVGRLASAALAVAAMLVARRLKVAAAWPYFVLGLGCWVALIGSGVEPVLAGVATGLAIPPGRSATRAEWLLGPVIAFVVLPVFALANAGVKLDWDALTSARALPVLSGIVLARVLGKLAGISAGVAVGLLAVARPPPGGRVEDAPGGSGAHVRDRVRGAAPVRRPSVRGPAPPALGGSRRPVRRVAPGLRARGGRARRRRSAATGRRAGSGRRRRMIEHGSGDR